MNYSKIRFEESLERMTQKIIEYEFCIVRYCKIG